MKLLRMVRFTPNLGNHLADLEILALFEVLSFMFVLVLLDPLNKFFLRQRPLDKMLMTWLFLCKTRGREGHFMTS